MTEERGKHDMKKLYDVTITFNPADFPGKIESVALRGEFLFYKSGLTGHTDETGMVDCDEKFSPRQYRDDLDHIGGLYYEEMKLNGEGMYQISFRLPAGVYPYHFLINPELDATSNDRRYAWSNMTMPDGTLMGLKNIEQVLQENFAGEKNHLMVDPKNPPVVPTVTGIQRNSELYIGTEEENICVPIRDPQKAGTITYISYMDIDDKPQSMAVYLPAGYDRTKVYPLILVSHGGGGNEADWPSQGSIGNIMDHLIAQGKTRPAILVCMNNSVYNWNYKKIADNCELKIIPFLQKIFNISDETKDRAFCGLSMGSMTTLYMYMHRSHLYDYFGAFSGGLAGGVYFTLDDPHLQDVTLMIGSAEEDIAYNQRDIGVPTTIRALKARGLPFIPYFVKGSHDWFCWSEMFTYFAENVLWKKNDLS